MGLISSPRKRGVKGRRLGLPSQRRGGKGGGNAGGEQCAAERQMSGCGADSGELDTWRPEVSISPAISMTPGLVLIGQDTSPNPSPVLLGVWSPLSSIRL